LRAVQDDEPSKLQMAHYALGRDLRHVFFCLMDALGPGGVGAAVLNPEEDATRVLQEPSE
jgi:hypothetical protein